MTDISGAAARRAPTVSSGLADGVYQRLRSAIVRGDLRPNERLVEADLAVWLEVSRTPVRECLQRLAAERLVANRRRGWVVLDHSIEDIREIYGVRAALEGYAAQLAARQASPDQVERIMALARIDPATYAVPPRHGFVEYNQQFHDTVVESCGAGSTTSTTGSPPSTPRRRWPRRSAGTWPSARPSSDGSRRRQSGSPAPMCTRRSMPP